MYSKATHLEMNWNWGKQLTTREQKSTRRSNEVSSRIWRYRVH